MIIYKYSLSEITDIHELELPRGAKPLKLAIQGGIPCLWVLVDPEEPLIKRRVFVAPTGIQRGAWIPSEEIAEYIDTLITHNDRLVLHYFLEKERP